MKKNSDILIKVLSLGIGLAVGIVLIAKVFFELSYDSFYKDIDRVYTIRTWYSQHGDEQDYGQVSGGVAVGFMEEVPGVEEGTRTTFIFNGDTYLDADGNKFKGNIACADTCFFKVFDRLILAGDPVKVLGKWGCMMVSRSFAEKLGGIQECIGKQIANANAEDLKLTIEGVFEDFPKNGSLDYDILLSMTTYNKESTDNWNSNDRYKGYVKLMPGVDPNTLTDGIRKMQESHQPLEQIEAQGNTFRYFLKPFSKMHTSAPEVRQMVILLSIVAALLILISLLNYILVVISSLVKRSKEVGVRKCYGAEGKHIYGMLTKEALLHILLSLVLAGAIIFAGRSIVENLLGVPFQTLLVPGSIVAIAAVILLVLFAVNWKIAPISGGYAFDMIPNFSWKFISSVISHYQLPFWSIVLISIGGQAVGMRSMSIYELNADYVKYARFLGIKDKKIVRYVFRNAMLPQVTGLAMSIGSMVGGALVAETIFSYPGLGMSMYAAINSSDYPVISACTLIITIMVLIASFMLDIIYAFIDPRVKAAQFD